MKKYILILTLIITLIVSGCTTKSENTEPCEEHKWSKGVCKICGAVCPHEEFENGQCTVCGITCQHKSFTNSVCDTCGYICTHAKNWDETGHCKVCGFACQHDREWTPDHHCTICGYYCEQHDFKDGKCTICGYTCKHPEWNNGKCTVCSYQCQHPAWKECECTVCHLVCDHDHFENGVCTQCGFVCNHPTHDKNRKCPICGEYTQHHFVNSVCDYCGEYLSFINSELTSDLFEPATRQGTVEKVSYDTVQYATGAQIRKHMQVYLPYNYSEDQQYNLLLMLPGMGATETFFLEDPHWYDHGVAVYLKDVFDRAIETGVCKPFIAVSLSWCDDKIPTDPMAFKDAQQVGQEIRNNILPYLTEHYSLYPEDGTYETLVDNRDHIAIYGLSYCALLIHMGVIPWCYDFISWYDIVSTASSDVGAAVNAIQQSGLPVNLYMCGYGTGEISMESTHAAYETLQHFCPQTIIDSYTAVELEFPGYGHNVQLFDGMLYNFLQVLF